jgi:hypothetical protein
MHKAGHTYLIKVDFGLWSDTHTAKTAKEALAICQRYALGAFCWCSCWEQESGAEVLPHELIRRAESETP